MSLYASHNTLVTTLVTTFTRVNPVLLYLFYSKYSVNVAGFVLRVRIPSATPFS